MKNSRNKNKKKLSRYERKLIRKDIYYLAGNVLGLNSGGFIPKAPIGGAK